MIFVRFPQPSSCKKKKRSVTELSGENFILQGEGSGTRISALRFFDDEGIEPNIIAEVDNLQTIKRLVIQNKGISLMYPPIVKEELEAGIISKISLDKTIYIYIDVEAAYIKKSLISPVIKAFLEVLKTNGNQ